MDEIVSIIDCVDDEKDAAQYVWEIKTKGGQKLLGILVGKRIFPDDGSIQTLLFNQGYHQVPPIEIPWSAIDTIRHAKELATWPTNKRPS